jgi:hypothetical protein
MLSGRAACLDVIVQPTRLDWLTSCAHAFLHADLQQCHAWYNSRTTLDSKVSFL